MANLDINALVVAQSVTENASKKKMVYTSDTTAKYWTVVDENIGEIMGFDDFTDASIETEMPSSLKMRTVSFSDSTGKVSGSYPVGKPTELIFVEGGTIKLPRKGSILGVVCSVTGAQGEKRKLASGQDTGQNAGDIN